MLLQLTFITLSIPNYIRINVSEKAGIIEDTLQKSLTDYPNKYDNERDRNLKRKQWHRRKLFQSANKWILCSENLDINFFLILRLPAQQFRLDVNPQMSHNSGGRRGDTHSIRRCGGGTYGIEWWWGVIRRSHLRSSLCPRRSPSPRSYLRCITQCWWGLSHRNRSIKYLFCHVWHPGNAMGGWGGGLPPLLHLTSLARGFLPAHAFGVGICTILLPEEVILWHNVTGGKVPWLFYRATELHEDWNCRTRRESDANFCIKKKCTFVNLHSE